MRRLALFTVLVGSPAGAGFIVRWENVTATPQRVESIGQPDFESVNVPANGAGERRFNRVGRYRLPGQFGWGGRRRPPEAVRALANGRSFTVNSGLKRYGGTSIQMTAAATAAMKVTFSRRR